MKGSEDRLQQQEARQTIHVYKLYNAVQREPQQWHMMIWVDI